MDLYPRADSPHFPLATSGAKAFIDRRRGLDVGTAQSTLTVIFKLIISGLTSVILVVLEQLIFSSRVHLFPFL